MEFNSGNKWMRTFATAARGAHQADGRSYGLFFGNSTLITSLQDLGSIWV